MLRIADWLEKLGLSEYAERFAENDIDTSVLAHLSDQDLKEIGVSLGHRRKMLAAIAELGSASAAARAASPVAPAPLPAAAEAAGERRYLTVMFCDLVGSTGISAQLDAEEWRDLVGSYLDAASAAVTGMGGHVAKKLGDGLMSLFGYPVAQENDAERAARAALSIQRALEEFHARLADTPHTWVEWSCSQLLQNTPLHPIAEWGRQRFGGADVPAERRLADLESSLTQVKLDPAENAALLAPLLDVPLPPGRVPALAPEELRRRRLAALTNWVMAGAKVQPVVLAFEDRCC